MTDVASGTMDITQLHRRALAETRRRVAGITAEQSSLATPCGEWDVAGLLHHVVAGNWWAAELASGSTIEEVGDRFDGDLLGDDALDAYDRSAEAAASAFERPGALSAPCAVSYGPVPGRVYAGHRFIDVFVHGWDLAVATGQSTELDPELVDACWAEIEPQLDMFAASGAFAAAPASLPTPPDERLLAALGRHQH